jgi:hypothetical protein
MSASSSLVGGCGVHPAGDRCQGAKPSYHGPMPDLDTRKVGDGPKRSSMWLDGVLYRLVEISDRWVWEREAS